MEAGRFTVVPFAMADAALSALLSLASHELRGPAGVIRGYLRMLESDPTLGERPRRVAGDANRAADRLVTLLDEIVELARLNDQTLRPALRAMSLRSILNQAVQAVDPAARIRSRPRRRRAL